MLCSVNSIAQLIPLQPIELTADTFLGYDSLGAYYYVSNNILTKETGKQTWQYKNPVLGKLKHVDLQNPLKLVLFFQDFNTVILLDNQLNETQKINLSEEKNPILPLGIGLASGNRLWIYNSLSQKVGLYDYAKKEYREITTPFANNVVYYESDFNYFRWIDELGQAMRCDVYGMVESLGKIPKNDQVQWATDTNLIYRKDDQLYRYEFNGNKSTFIEIGKKSFKNFSYKDQILSIFTDHGITNYKISIP